MIKRLLGYVTKSLLSLVVAGLTLWSMFALYLGDSSTNAAQVTLASAFGVLGLATVIAIFCSRLGPLFVGVFVLGFLIVLGWWLSITPSNERDWQRDVERLPYATVEGDLVTVHNIRNFSYRTETDYVADYYSQTYDLSELESVDLFAVYWMGPAIAHTIISFGFGQDRYLAVSIEARKEVGEGYSAVNGFFKQYELVYVVADERDVIGLRTHIREQPPEDVYRYRLQGSRETGKAFFLEYMKVVNGLVDEPQFYNTLLTNCTNAIWMNAHVNPDRIPFSWKLLASGYLPEYLHETGRLNTALSFAELEQAGYVNPLVNTRDISSDFSRLIRGSVRP